MNYLDSLKKFFDSKDMEASIYKEELQNRIKNAKENPESLVTWNDVLKGLEKDFGREIKIK
ncbi:MAG: hypothetical protein AAF518_23490 [Spirochaetota bacterium]